MKKFKNLMLMLALALFFVGAMGMTKASAEDATPAPSVTKIAEDKATVEYADELVMVVCDDQVYYQVVKSATPGTLKPANWIKAAKGDDAYYIDFSGLANGKDGFIALTANNAATEADTVATIDAVVKSVKVTLNYKTEEVKNGLADIITTLNVKGVDGNDDKADGTVADYSVVWKRGANGNWDEAKNFSQLQWDMLKASNGTLYVAIDGKVADDKTVDFRMSKEAKVKIPKAAKAPSVKVDFTKGTVALKNGMQVKEAGDADWVDVAPYDKNETTNTDIFGAKATKTKVSNVAVADLIANLDTEVKAGEELSIEVRTAATDKKFPSATGTLSFKTPAQNPAASGTESEPVAITYTAADKTAKVVAEFTIDFKNILNIGTDAKFDQYEYILVKVAADEVDFSKQKWTKLPADGVLNLASKIGKEYKYVKKDGTSVTAKYEETTAIYIRKVADKTNGLFPSDMAKSFVKITKADAYAINVTANENVEVSYKVGEGTALKAKAGEKVTLTCTVAEGYEKLTVTVKNGDNAVEVANTDGVYSFTMPAGNVTVTTAVEKKAEASES